MFAEADFTEVTSGKYFLNLTDRMYHIMAALRNIRLVKDFVKKDEKSIL